MDLIASILLLVITAPIFALISVCIKFEDTGPVFYKQTRLTKGGEHFRIIKFRSMHKDAEADGIARLAKENDYRITKVGRFIRKTHLDELPQLINVLKGEMSMVGPRPERPELMEQYHQQLPEFYLRLMTKAGITGYAQIYGKYDTPPGEKLKMDLMYILNHSLREDFKILILTFLLLFWKKNANDQVEEKLTPIIYEEVERDKTAIVL